jgi:hypothetical protein
MLRLALLALVSGVPTPEHLSNAVDLGATEQEAGGRAVWGARGGEGYGRVSEAAREIPQIGDAAAEQHAALAVVAA